jgi:hypothetical protein
VNVSFKRRVLELLILTVTPLFVLVAAVAACGARLRKPRASHEAALVWGSTPLINNRYWSAAMKQAGYRSETFTDGYFATVNQRSDWDRLLGESYRWMPLRLRPLVAFIDSLLRYDVFFFSSDGFFIGRLPWIWRWQAPLFKLAGKKIVFIPYGADSFVYRRVRNSTVTHGLIASYPGFAREQDVIAARLDYWIRHADACIPATMGMDGFGRWTVAIPSVLSLDLGLWGPSVRHSQVDGRNGTVVLCHAPNHRSLKGTEFVVHAVQQLQAEGLKVELRLLEKLQNVEVRRILREDVDILVEQLVFIGHGLNALEGMASALPVVSNLEDPEYMTVFRRWSYFGECPIVSATPENVADVLRQLVTRPDLRRQLGAAGRQYVEKYHGLDSAAYLFSNVLDHVYGERESLANLYHPLLGDYPKRLPRVTHPLRNNRILD